jgi:hypothetical protein
VVDWFGRTIVDTGRLPLFCFFAGMVVGFGFIRFSVRMIRAQVKWWPGNVSSGGTHLHHVVFGVVFMLIGGVAGLTIPSNLDGWRAVVAALFGIGAALVLDEFALILHLDDVYWSERGRTSIDAVFVAVAFSGLLVLGVRPVVVDDLLVARSENTGAAAWISGAVIAAINFALAGITLLKGKIWTGLIGLFLPVLIVVGAIRLARPQSPWARWRYAKAKPRARRKLTRAANRDRRFRRPMIAAKVWLQDVIAGRPDLPKA